MAQAKIFEDSLERNVAFYRDTLIQIQCHNYNWGFEKVPHVVKCHFDENQIFDSKSSFFREIYNFSSVVIFAHFIYLVILCLICLFSKFQEIVNLYYICVLRKLLIIRRNNPACSSKLKLHSKGM